MSRDEYYELAGHHNNRLREDSEDWRTDDGLFKIYNSNSFYYTVSKQEDDIYINKNNKIKQKPCPLPKKLRCCSIILHHLRQLKH